MTRHESSEALNVHFIDPFSHEVVGYGEATVWNGNPNHFEYGEKEHWERKFSVERYSHKDEDTGPLVEMVYPDPLPTTTTTTMSTTNMTTGVMRNQRSRDPWVGSHARPTALASPRGSWPPTVYHHHHLDKPIPTPIQSSPSQAPPPPPPAMARALPRLCIPSSAHLYSSSSNRVLHANPRSPSSAYRPYARNTRSSPVLEELDSHTKAVIDDYLLRYLNYLCIHHDAVDRFGRRIHQQYTAKKIERDEQLYGWRPLKFRIEAFVNAFIDV
ncbi:hypothetical protein FRC17_006394, partial [Serendipita sp. 399]